MDKPSYDTMANFVRDDLRLKTLPIAIKFSQTNESFPEKTSRPSVLFGKRVTICQAVTMARVYGWTVGLTKEDIICVPAMLAFGFTNASDPAENLGNLFCEVEFAKEKQMALDEVKTMYRLENSEKRAITISPWVKNLYEPDAVAFYGNPAQIMRMVQAIVFEEGVRIQGNFGGKVECSEYLIAPYLTGKARIAMPGMGDRIFSMTQDDEMVLSVPKASLISLYRGLSHAGKKIGARYPVTFYQNFQPEFPEPYQKLAKKLDLF
ncbi:MAG: DUF169 domain-containing protein [Desulfobacterales bacterium]